HVVADVAREIEQAAVMLRAVGRRVRADAGRKVLVPEVARPDAAGADESLGEDAAAAIVETEETFGRLGREVAVSEARQHGRAVEVEQVLRRLAGAVPVAQAELGLE